MFKILIVDDMKSVHSFVKNLLGKAEGLNVTSVFNGQEALQTLKAGNQFDLIFLDWEMPVMTGPETLLSFSQIKLSTPVIMMTTKNSADDIQNMLSLGASEYILKPFTVDILFDKMNFVTGKEFKYAA